MPLYVKAPEGLSFNFDLAVEQLRRILPGPQLPVVVVVPARWEPHRLGARGLQLREELRRLGLADFSEATPETLAAAERDAELVSSISLELEQRKVLLDVANYQRDRAQMLLADARTQCERRTNERDLLAVSGRHLGPRVALGEAVLAMLAQIDRIRATEPAKLGYGCTPAEMIAGIRSELVEVEQEASGSHRARQEAIDAVWGCFHLARAHGASDADILELLHGVVAKVKRRLDHIDHDGGTWASAKLLEQPQVEKTTG